MTRFRLSSATALTAVSLALIVAPATAGTNGQSRELAPRTQFTMAPDGSSGAAQGGAGIPNIDSVKSTIRTYYNATDGIADKDSSPYISEMRSIENDQWGYLVNSYYEAVDAGRQPAIVFDADDTTLWTYDMEDGAMKFNFDPTLQNQWVQDKLFPATPGMVDFVNRAKRLGYAVFGITGRDSGQEEATLGNLSDVGYTPFDADNFYTKWTSAEPQPDYVTCAVAKCTTVEYKANTRKHIEDDLGYDIVLNVGDQWSDLQGGHADRSLKLPNPTYFLPSPDLDGSAADADFSPRSEFTMAPDGSSGLAEDGEGIPNIDIVKSTIRNYYGATAGIANKTESPYISEMSAFADKWAPRVRSRCATLKARHKKPGVVFDADDTTLWTYDMEDGAMKFNFDPTLQDVWVQDQRFPATPQMARVVRAAHKGGCRIFGLTGRHNSQRTATIANLNSLYDDAFKSRFYFTKWDSDQQPPAYVDCADPAHCSTIEYKSSTRKHIIDRFGVRLAFNFGDQFSDLIGGHSGHEVKLPNPTYYLP